MQRILLSTCGTSILTKGLSSEHLKIILKYSNANQKTVEQATEWPIIKQIITDSNAHFLSVSEQDAIQISAEWNCLHNYMLKKQSQLHEWLHYLLPTDTFLGQETARIIAERLRQNGVSPIILEQRYLQTSDADRFKEGVTELTQQLEHLCHSGHYSQIVFNLTGGFKALNAYLQSLSTLFATTSIYLFEKSTEIIEIPSLPLKIDMDVLKDNVALFQKLEMKDNLSEEETQHLQGTLILNCDGLVDWSVWGQALWLKGKTDIYAQQLFIPEDIDVNFDLSKQWQQASLEHRYRINQALFYLAQYNRQGKEPPSSFKIKPLHGNTYSLATHEIYVWSDGSGYRFFWHKQNQRVIIQKLSSGFH